MKQVNVATFLIKATFIVFLISSFFSISALAQTYNDGPVNVKMKVRNINVNFSDASDGTLNFGGTSAGLVPDEYTFNLWARDVADVDGIGWGTGTGCLTENLDPGQGQNQTNDFDSIFYNQTYAGSSVPQFLDLRLDAWEAETSNDNVASVGDCDGDRCSFDSGNISCGCLGLLCAITNEQDDRRCDGNPFKTQMDYRQGPPCQWYNHGFINGNCSNTEYEPQIETYWRYTNGDSCSIPISLGTINPGDTVSHFNSNECYNNAFSQQPGNDVYYSFSVNSPVALEMSLCGNTSFDTYLYLINNNCVIDTFNDDFCGNASQITKSICNPGTYKLVVDGASASAMGTFTISVADDPSFSFSVDAEGTDVSCNGADDGEAIVTPLGGTSPYDFQWSTNDTTQMIDSLSTGSYSVTVTDATGCQASDTTTITEPAPLTTTISKTDVTCSGASNGSASVDVSGGTTPYSYEWNTTPTQTSDSAISLNPGNYIVTVTDANGCRISDSITVNTVAAIDISVQQQNNVSCKGEADGNITISVSGGNTPYDYVWSNGDSTASISNLGPGTYSVTVFDQDECSQDTSLTITEPDSLALSLEKIENVACKGDETGAIDISTTGGTTPYNYNWSNNSQDEDQLGLPAATYAVTVTDDNGCTDTLSNLNVEALSDLSTSISGTDPSCYNADDGSIEVIVTGGQPPYDYFWSNFSGDSLIENAEGGSYLVVIEDEEGCQIKDSITLNEPSRITTDFSIKGISCQGEQDGAVSVSASGGTAPYSYNWSNSATGKEIADLGPGDYTVTVTDDENCSDTSSVELQSATEECVVDTQETYAIEVPNAFSPNDDGLNDEFQILHNGAREIHLKIFNRWGELIYEDANVVDANEGWDGTIDGQKAPVGSYVYVINGSFDNGENIKESGSLVLLR